MVKSFEEFPVYQKSLNFTIKIFNLLDSDQLKNDYTVLHQLKRAALSITNNIAEGSEYDSNTQFIRFLWIAKGSCAECRNILNILKELKKLSIIEFEELNLQSIEISKEIYHFIKYLEKSNTGKK